MYSIKIIMRSTPLEEYKFFNYKIKAYLFKIKCDNLIF